MSKSWDVGFDTLPLGSWDSGRSLFSSNSSKTKTLVWFGWFKFILTPVVKRKTKVTTLLIKKVYNHCVSPLDSISGVSNSRPAGQLRPAGRYFVAPTFIWKFNVSAAREFCIVATPLLAAVWDNVMMFWFPTVCLSSECSMHVSDMGGGVVCGVVCVCEWEREPREKRVAFDVRRAGGWKS